jgi:hypothetical protein
MSRTLGGYRLRPTRLSFGKAGWAGCTIAILYELTSDGTWSIKRLARVRCS